MNRGIHKGATLKVGGTIVSKYKAVGDAIEVALVIEANGTYFGVLAHSRQGHRANKLQPGQMVEVEGPVVSDMWPDYGGGWVPAYSITCKRLRLGDEVVEVKDPLEDYPELPKFKVFYKCMELNQESKSHDSIKSYP